MSSRRRLCLIVFAFPAAHAHGSLVIPPSRNNFGQKDPSNRTGSAHFTQGPCVGGACLWFSEGCFLGCPACSARMPAGGNQHDVPNCPNWTEPEITLPDAFRTFNKANLSAAGDWTRFHPWRSPGAAPTSDPCGVAGAYVKPRGGGGETPIGAHQGDLGSKLPSTAPTTWVGGTTAEVGWMIGANHGGGYHYSLCPKGAPLTEACFRRMGLAFADGHSTIRYLRGRLPERSIEAVDVAAGTHPAGSVWRRNPIPGCACDWGRDCQVNGTDSLKRAYRGYGPSGAEAAAECHECKYAECGRHVALQFAEPFEYGHGQQIWDRPVGHVDADDWVIVDRVRVPSTAGEFVLRWRWDTEQNPQIWSHCADVVIR